MRSTSVLVVTAALLGLAGCKPSMDVRVDAAPVPAVSGGMPSAELRRFAMSQTPDADRAAYDLVAATKAAMVRHAGGLISSPGGRFGLTTPGDAADLARVVAAAARNSMVERGYAFDESSPQFLVSIGFVHGYFQPYERPGLFGGIGASSDDGVGVGVGVNVGPDPVYAADRTYGRSVAVFFYDPAQPEQPFWHGAAITVGVGTDFNRVMPLLLDEALGEFPHPSGKPAVRPVSPPSE